VQNTIAKYRLEGEDIYNFDKAGFQIGVIATGRVITSSEQGIFRSCAMSLFFAILLDV
jgi:hypothetical protein